MATSKNTRKSTANASDATIKPTLNGSAEHIEALKQSLHMDSETFWERMGFRAYSVQTTITKLVARVVLYAIGAVAAMYTVAWLSALLTVAGWPLFIVAVVEIIGIVLGLVAAWTASDAIIDYIAAGNVSRDLKRVGSWLGNNLINPIGFVRSHMTMH